MLLLKWLIGVLAVFGGFVGLMYVKQRSLMYHPDALHMAPAAAGFAQAEEVSLQTADGETVIVWHVPPRGERPVIVYFHGNAGTLRDRVEHFRGLVAGGDGLVALSYRGYGGSTGSPSEPGLIADARAAYDFAVARYPAGRIALWGESLGTGVAVALATEREAVCVVLKSPFSSAVDIGAVAYPYLPVRALMKDQFRSDLRIRQVHVPVLIMHGDRDTTVPIAFAERLYALANEPKRMMRFAGGNHNDLDTFGASAAGLAFIDEAVAAQSHPVKP